MKKSILCFSVFLLFFIVFIGCSVKKLSPEIKPEWAKYLDSQEQQIFSNLIFFKPSGIGETILYAQYQYQMGYITNCPVPRNEAIELSKLEAAASALYDNGLRYEDQLRLFELRYYYGKYSTLSRNQAKELARLLVDTNKGYGSSKKSARIRELFLGGENGSRTAE